METSLPINTIRHNMMLSKKYMPLEWKEFSEEYQCIYGKISEKFNIVDHILIRNKDGIWFNINYALHPHDDFLWFYHTKWKLLNPDDDELILTPTGYPTYPSKECDFISTIVGIESCKNGTLRIKKIV